MSSKRKSDHDWVRGMFGLSPMARDRRNLSILQPSTVDHSFADTTLGGGPAINMAPAFTQFADLPSTGLLASRSLRGSKWYESDSTADSQQCGRVYQELFNDNSYDIHIQFGVPKYTGSIAFFANMYDRDAAILAKRGEYSKILRTAGEAAGLVGMFALFGPYVMIPLIISVKVLGICLNKTTSKYWYLKATMNLYWQAVQNLCDTMLLHYRLVPMWNVIGADRYITVEDERNKLHNSMKDIYSALPDIWKSNGKFDVMRAVSRYQVLADYQAATLSDIYNNSKSDAEYNQKIKVYLSAAKHQRYMADSTSEKELSLEQMALAYQANPLYQTDDALDSQYQQNWEKTRQSIEDKQNGVSSESIITEQDVYLAEKENAKKEAGTAGTKGTKDQTMGDLFGSILEQGFAELKDGTQWLSLRVNAKESVSASFNNDTKEPEISSTLNSMSSKARSFDFSTSNQQTGFSIVDDAITGIKDFLGGTLDSVHLTGLAAVYGASVIDIPDTWESSSANISTHSYTIPLRTPYGNDFNLFQDIQMPLMCILAGVLPIATGKQTYQSPFVCSVIGRGKQLIRTGIITGVDLSIGTGNIGWRADGKPLGIDVTLTIKDLSKIVAMPLIKDPGVFDEATKLTDFLAMLGGASLHEMTYGTSQFAININKWKQSWKSRFMVGRITNDIFSAKIARVASGLTAGTTLK